MATGEEEDARLPSSHFTRQVIENLGLWESGPELTCTSFHIGRSYRRDTDCFCNSEIYLSPTVCLDCISNTLPITSLNPHKGSNEVGILKKVMSFSCCVDTEIGVWGIWFHNFCGNALSLVLTPPGVGGGVFCPQFRAVSKITPPCQSAVLKEQESVLFSKPQFVLQLPCCLQ